MESTLAAAPNGNAKELPLNLLLRELAECLKAASGEEPTSQASDADTLAPQMQRILLQLVKRCTKRRENLLKHNSALLISKVHIFYMDSWHGHHRSAAEKQNRHATCNLDIIVMLDRRNE